ncbi:uncharacterized protein LOC120633521 isoform X3 [Pararge aegeria]|uniref:uncharacterized protein LOC120633521 isoform X3 n=1 Tax=Pararge aegeria TaxID=116150 RepID=UPI0019D2DFFA|nr:uncharacterized protein LOC120633521 isoform X3 [Pararge aegeria]
MSEAIDIDTDNICTTEDAFEQFQSVSMYEENEFITLSDIVAPPPPNPDISEILHEIPTEDVSPLLLVEEPLNQVTSTTGQNVQETTPKKRGRKKKINVEASASRESAECTALTDSEHSKNNVTSQGLELENNASNTVQTLPETPIDTTPLVQPLKRSKRQYNRQATKKQAIQQKKIKKRGRKPKNIKVPTPSTNNENYNVTDIVNNSSNIKEPMEKKQLNTSKRGRRKKKIPSELNESSNEIIIEPEINSDLASPADQARLPNENVEKEPKKGKRVKKNDIKQQSFDEIVVEKQKSDNQELVSNELTDDDIEDVPLMVLSNKMVLSNNVEKTDSTNFDLGTENDLLKEITPPIETNDDIILVQRTPRKRGRPKKVDSNNSIHIKSSEDENDITATNSIVKSHTDVPGLNNSKDCTNETVAKKNYIECTENIDDDDDVIKKESTQSDFYNKRNSKKPNMSDFEYNIDSIIKNDHPEDNVHQQFSDHSDTKTGESSKRPIRRKVKKNLHYDEGSDEDPYANIELSDDEPRRRKGGRYHSDDEYIPGSKRQLSDLSDSDIDIDEEVEDEEDLLNDSTKQKSRKYKRSETGLIKSPRKKAKKGDKSKPNNLDVFTQKPTIEDGNGDLEDLLETSIIKTSDDTPKAWGTTKEFKDFLDKISQGTDIKIKKAKSMDNSKTLLQIPVLDQNEAKKTAEMCAQTDTIKTKSISVQTSSVYEVPMKNQVSLTAHQSDKACEFLSGIVKTTAELGQLMTQKSEDFIEKKINTTYVTDTIKMDYCVKKSFLLFRLAKHNLVQMEEDLAKQYQEFLQENNLIQHREEQKIIESTSKAANSDSDCEIVEEPVLKDKEVKSVFNPKTVFLNKELSIKIAKKHSEEPKPKEKLNIKGRHTVWINDSIMVKKVKPTQSFLAQDSRNKKPPDTYITLEMVSDFFKIYNRQKAISICAQFVRPEWCNLKQNYSCCYFYDKTCESSENSTQFDNTEELTTEVPITENNLQNLNDIKCLNRICPNSLLTLCTKVIQKMMSAEDIATKNIYYLTENIEPSMINPCNLQNTCNDGTKDVKHFRISNNDHKNQLSANIGHLKTLCYRKLIELICLPDFSESNVKKKLSHDSKTKNHEVVEDFCNEKPECSAVMEKVKPLFSLCLNIIVQVSQEALDTSNLVVENKIFFQPNSLKCLVFSEVKNMFYNRMCKNNNFVKKGKSVTEIGRDFIPTESKLDKDDISHKLKPTSLLSLKSLCIDVVNYHIFGRLKQSSPISLNSLCVHIINKILIGNYSYEEINVVSHIGSPNFTINDVNTVSEDVFLNNTSENYIEDNQIEPTYLEEEENNFSDDCEANYDNSLAGDDNNWVSQVQMQELRSFVEPTITSDREKSPQAPDFFSNGAVNIKVEPADELSENIAESYVKLEPLDEEDTTFMPLVTITKQEVIEATGSSKEPNVRENSNSYDENTFEAFVSSNKMIMSLNSYETDNDDIFTQSTSRVRRQHEPDSDGEVENFADSLNLLVPQNIETAKDRLMASSSDEDTNRKKKPEKRGRGRPKRSTKTNIAAPVKENVTSKSDLAVLTRKMREKIRQVEKQNESSESELEDTALRVTKDKEKIKDKPQKKQSNVNIDPEKEIQCNDVDSTEQINENDAQQNENAHHEVNQTAVNYDSDKAALSFDKEQNLHDDEYRQVMDMDDMSYSPLIDANEPVEMLECEPTLPIFDTCVENTHIKRKPKLQIVGSRPGPACSKRNYIAPYIDRHDWNRYPIDTKDNKIYCHAQIMLHKLPESFVQTYLKYQNLSMQSKDDSEVDKLINLQSLHRNQSKEKGHLKVKDVKNASIDHGKTKSSDVESVTQTNIKVEHFEELLPSEDEGDNTEDIQPVVTSQPTADNCLAKDFLMNDEAESDSEKPDGESNKLEKSPKKPENSNENPPTTRKAGRPPKSKVEEDKVKPHSENLMLTADKMMTIELSMLHAPVELKQEIPDIKEVVTRSSTKNANKTSPKTNTAKEQRDKDDSSSEEEKQWFTTKEKLLKRLEKKQECPSVDDAKRAKIVSEFIEKRSDGPQIRLRSRPPRRRSMKKLMEKRKQMKILTRELLGDDAAHPGKKSYQTYGKGRRNIRKVINKKALSHSTVVANMEEFERKQRLSLRQTQLREILGCEEGVNVVVINDELCLEYDFDELRPVVTVDPFFTKVMKAHQYEGVKFMWDACFESVSQVQSGHAGGGCILAHCMGLGKTLQVLALLHTVLTHPRVGMQRVLVCCPLSTVLNWVDEIHKWIGPVKEQIKNRKFKRKLQVFELSKLKKTYERAYQLEDWYNGGGIFIIGYELFRSLSTLDPVLDCVRTTILNKIRTALLDPGPDIVICDEGHLLKNDCSVLAVAMSRVKTRRRIILTGTPMQNNLREYYCMVNFVKPSLLGSYSEYSNRFENPIMNGQHRDSIEEDIKLMKARTHILHKVLEGCLQRQEASVLYPYLPKKHEYTVFVSLTKSQRELYTHYLTNYAKETKQSVLKDFHVLQKIWTHPQVLHNFFMKSRDEEKQQKIKVEKEDDLVAEDLGASEDTKPSTMETWWLPYVAESEVLDALHSSNKFLVIFRLLDECIALGDKVLIFSTSLYTMDALEYFLRRINNWSLGREYYRLDGSVPAEVRQKWCREFNAESNTGTKLFLISTRAGSLGLNMTAANRVVILDTSWNPAHDIQSIFRVYRFGQKKDCYIYRLVAMGTMEQKIYERSVTKQAVACRVVDEQQIDRHYNMSELTELYRLDEDGAGVAAGLAAGVRDAALLRVAASDTPCGPLLYAVHEHDSLLRGSGEIGLAEDERAAVWSQFQEEHANKHIQSIALKLPKKEFDPKIPKSENAQNDANNQSVPGGSDTKPKSKRGRKPLQACKNMPVQPSTSSQDELFAKPKLEKSMIQKIMDILIQHNFHTTNGPKEISELIQNVQKTVSNPKRGRLRNIDPVTASIARVLIEEGTISIPPPAFTGTNVNQSQYLEPTESAETIVGTPADYNSIYCVDQNQETNIQSEYSSRKRRRQRKEADTTLNQEQTTIGETHSTETIVGTPVENSIYFEVPKIQETQESVDSDNPERKRRRNRRESDEEYIPDKQKIKNMPTDKLKHNTRKSNEYNLSLASVNNDETITSDLPSVSITLPDTEESQVTLLANQKNLMKNEKEKKRKTSKKKSKQENLSYIEKETASQQGIIEKLIIKQTVNDESEPVNAIESILLSDEDEPLVAAPVTAPDVQAAASRIKVVKQQSNQQNDQSPIPLHKSLLTNKNFIKIVAHTYLTGKPQLAEDAAILAAQYSTLKALKELEATNKDIVSGPIYDIAVQVLGKDLLKKLHNASAPKKDSGTIRPSTVPDQSENDKKSNKNKSVNDSEVVPQTKIKKKPQNHIERTITLIDDDILKPSTSSSVRKSKKAGPKSVAALEVVPVEMFEVPSTLRSRYPSQDECILPDDDDDFIVSDSPNIVSQSQTHRNQRNSQPTSINLSSINTDRIATRPKVVQIVQKQPVVNPIPLPPPPVVLNTISKPFSKESQCGSSVQTICLDSDEEVAPVEPVETATRKVLKSTTKLPHSSSSNTADSEAVTVKQQSKFTTLLDKKKKIVQVNATNSEPSKKAKSPNIRAPSQNISVTSDESVFIIAHNVSEEDGPLSVMKSKCMPGDIMRINKDGMIEILNKTDTAPAAINANKPHAVNASASDSCVEILPEESVKEPINRVKTTALSSNKKTPANSKPICNKKTPATTNKTINPTKAPATTHKTINLTKTPTFGSSSSKFKATENTSYVIESTERARKSYPSSNDNLRSESPDPLSVLQNVVHIPADKYQANKQMNTKESYSRQKSSTFIVTKTADSNMARASSDLAVKRAEALLKSYDSTKSQNKAAKVIDLTEAFAAASEVPRPTPTKKGSTAPIKLVTNIKISGTSKDILINNAGAVSNAKNKPSTSFDSSTFSGPRSSGERM